MSHRNFRQKLKEMQTESKMVMCALLNGSAWRTAKKVMGNYNGTFDVFFRVERRMGTEEMEQQFINKFFFF